MDDQQVLCQEAQPEDTHGNKRRIEWIRPLTYAVCFPLVMFASETACLLPQPRWLGIPAALIIDVGTVIVLCILLAPIMVLYHLVRIWGCRRQPYARSNAIVRAVAWAIFVPFTILSLHASMHVQTKAFAAAGKRAEPIVQALGEFKEDNGSYPEDLSELSPQYLEEIPYTGLISYPRYMYRKGFHDMEQAPDSFELRIRCPRGVLNFDSYIYWPTQDYPDRIQDNSVERIGKWAYLHE